MIGVIDYGIGNLGSVANALQKLNRTFQVSGDPTWLKKADLLILPGVGAAGIGMANLQNRKLDKFLIREIKKGKPFLGICLGMQLMFDKSEEGEVSCLGILKGKVRKFQKEKKVPQIGWNKVKLKKSFGNIPDNSYFYFVNSYYCLPDEKSIIVGETIYGENFASVIVKDNIVATQFHPEKSGQVGFQLLNNIIKNYVN